MKSYPITLPCPLLAGNSNGTSTTFKRSTTAFYKQQRRFSRGTYVISFSAIMTTSELQEFRAWYLTSINEMDIFEAEWEVEGVQGTKKFKFLESYNVSSYEYDLHHVSAPVQMMTTISNDKSKFPLPIAITDFNASNNKDYKIEFSWTNSLATLRYDIFKDATLWRSNVTGPYTEPDVLNTIVDSYTINQVGQYGEVLGNSDNGQALNPIPTPIIDFSATDGEPEQITYTWTDDSNTYQYDLYKDDVLHISDITSGYTESTSFGITNSYKVKQINVAGEVDSNSDDGTASEVFDYQFIFSTDLTGDIKFDCYGDDFELSDNGGLYTTYSPGSTTMTPTGDIRIKVGANTTTFKFWGDNTQNSRITDFSILDLSTFTSFVSFDSMLNVCSNLINLNIPGINSTINITTIQNMVTGCTSLTQIPFFNTSNVIDFSGAFSNCDSISTVPLFDTSKGIDFDGTFGNNSNLTLIPSIDTSSGIYFLHMFRGCPSLESIPFIDTTLGTSFQGMYADSSSLTCITNIDTTGSTLSFDDMFDNTPSLVNPSDSEQSTILSKANYINQNSCNLAQNQTAITDFNASDGLSGKIIFTWTNDVYSSSYDLYENNILIEINIHNDFELTKSDTDVRTYKIEQIGNLPGIESNTDTGFNYILPISITDFDASNNYVEGIKFTWTNDIYSVSYDLYEDDILIKSNITSGYVLDKLNEDVKSYKLNQIGEGISNEVFSNLDDGNAIASPGEGNIEFDTDLTGDVQVSIPNGTLKYDVGDGIILTGSYDIIMSPVGTVKLWFIGVSGATDQFRFSDGGTGDNGRITSITINSLGTLHSLYQTFQSLSNLTEFIVTDQNAFSNITKMNSTWYYCPSLTSLPPIDTSSVTDFTNTFRYSAALTCLSNIDTTNQTTTTAMFDGCTSLVAPDATDQTAIEAGTNWTNPGSCP